MKTWYMIFAAACAVSIPAFADGDGEGEEPVAIRVTSDTVTFKLRTGDGTAAVASTDLATWPVTYRTGETVTLTSPAGASTTPVSGAAANGTTELAGAFNADGVWRLANSNGGSALVGVAWETFGASWREASADASCRMHTEGEGPDRKLKKSETPPVAYSGDNWVGDLSKAATVTFTPPEGSGLEPTEWNKTGRGAESFTFNAKGVWTVTLMFADNTTRTAHIDIKTEGFMLIVK
ncbi:MAG: hypothetical protein J6T51_02760 [Kiritimatiellae bacterium]|nr:hypothetical protein [Kiritimatiellia bacterium]